MSDVQWTPPPSQPDPHQVAAQTRQENVLMGLIFALAAVIGGALLTAVLWRLGFIAAITGYAIAAGAVFLYVKGSGAAPKAGLVPLILLIVGGVVFSFYAAYLSDLFKAYDDLAVHEQYGLSRWQWYSQNIWHQEFLTKNVLNAVLFLGFGALGAFRTLAGLVTLHRA